MHKAELNPIRDSYINPTNFCLIHFEIENYELKWRTNSTGSTKGLLQILRRVDRPETMVFKAEIKLNSETTHTLIQQMRGAVVIKKYHKK